jgi:hypothetical protein
MEFANDLMAVLRDRAQPGGATGETAGSDPLFDWSGLHARLCAAHAVRQVMTQSDSRPIMRCGGFSDWPLVACDQVKQSHGVNLNDLTDGKGPHDIATDTAGQVHVGGRGK